MVGGACTVLLNASLKQVGWNPVPSRIGQVVEKVGGIALKPGADRGTESFLGRGASGLGEYPFHRLSQYALCGARSGVVSASHGGGQFHARWVGRRLLHAVWYVPGRKL